MPSENKDWATLLSIVENISGTNAHAAAKRLSLGSAYTGLGG
jgi:hypothetical protein